MSLNPRQQKFAELMAAGQTAKAAYFEAFPRCRSEKTAEAEGSRLSKNPKVMEMIEAIQWETTDTLKSELIASKKELAEFLTEVIRTPAGTIDEEHKLCQSFKFTKGERSLKIPDKIKAAERLSKLMGYDKPEQVKVEAGDSLQKLFDEIRAGESK